MEEQATEENHFLQLEALNVGDIEGQKGVKELARMFSARSKKSDAMGDNFQKPQSLKQINLKERLPISGTEIVNDDMSSTDDDDPMYQNILDEAQFIVKPKESEFLMPAKRKKPVPTPRKTSLPVISPVVDDSSDEDGYTPMSTTISDLQSLKPEVHFLQNVSEFPYFKPPNGTASSLTPMNSGVLDAARDRKEQVTIGFSDNEDDNTEYYLPVLSDQQQQYYPGTSIHFFKGKGVVHRRIPTEKNGKQSEWKRSQGSIFAEEMINLVSGQNGDCYHSPVSINAENIRESTHSYIEINENCLRKFPIRVLSATSTEPVYIEAEDGCGSMYVMAESSPLNECTCALSKELKCSISPPDLFPKSKSLLRELDDVPLSSDVSLTPSNNPRRSKKSPNLIKVLKPQQFVMNKKKKKLSPNISSPRLPLYPPSKKVMDTETLCESEISSTSSPILISKHPPHSKLSASKSFSMMPSKIATSASLDDIPSKVDHFPFERNQSLSQSPPTTKNIHRTTSDAARHKVTFANQENDEIGSCPGQDCGCSPVIQSSRTCRSSTLDSSKTRGVEESNLSANTRAVGYFTCQGGKLMSRETGVYITVPEDAIHNGKRQKLWFEVLQSLCKEDENFQESLPNMFSREVEHSGSSSVKKENPITPIQLSLTVSVGPPDAVLNKPIKVFIPHCAAVDSTIWNLKVIGRSTVSDDWEQLVPSGSHFKPNKAKYKKYRNSTYKIYSDYFRVKTKHVGCFRMTGRPVGPNPTKVSKKMVSSVYLKRNSNNVKIKFFITNAFLDSVEALYHVMTSEGYTCIDRNIPTICQGDHNDLNVSLLVETNEGKTATRLQVIPFEMFWRVTRIGKAVATFDLCGDVVMNRIIKIELNQSGHHSQVFEFLLPA